MTAEEVRRMNDGLFSSVRLDWATPQSFFDLADAETVEAIHQPSTCYDSCSYPHDCRACLVEWPCPTALAVGAVVREVSDDRA